MRDGVDVGAGLGRWCWVRIGLLAAGEVVVADMSAVDTAEVVVVVAAGPAEACTAYTAAVEARCLAA